ncbi:HD family phosphohydrolase [Salisediminibacterium halotolerans]|uniref:HD family phosphohydrolase n=1 Tax=Salisediminibacterium halotolerans TaxID=517425 RepID=UPI000EB4367E|nr:HD family phosphohydrolase [Salisediminibacterium halotolerans]RLJ78156.1 hypothetical protein BCL39_0626 [Actinophytocola xinjiangensis]RPE88505.1 hypothetical protein EDD67_0833 [Salisediminibacterium halotolerans]TWG37133.1 hypothetical protein BCL52_0625 [Salisediminibacterium halotolerans]GEL07271.1 cyclic-di-AMP phosphodiesterase PgpH [Salisediminibacterium halotolerans]
MAERISIDQQRWWQKRKNHRYTRIVMFAFLGLITYGLLASNVMPEHTELEPGTVAQQDIRSPLTIENQEATEQQVDEAVNEVDPVYSKNPRYAENQIEQIRELFYVVEEVRADADTENENNDNFAEDQLADLRTELPDQMNDEIDDETIATLLTASESEVETALEHTTSAVHDVMSSEIRMDDIADATNEAETQVRLSSSASDSLVQAMTDIVRFGVTSNFMIDEEATVEAREAAEDTVDPVMIREGELLVEEGEVITAEIHQELSVVGMTEDVSIVYPFVGLALLVTLLISMLAYYLNDARTSIKQNNTYLLLYVFIYTLTLLLMKVVSLMHPVELSGLSYIVPAALGTMLITILIHSRVGLFTSMVFAVIASIMFTAESASVLNYAHGLYVFFSGAAGVFFLIKSQTVSRLLQAGVFIAFINAVVAAAVLMLQNAQYSWFEIGSNLGFAGLSGFIAAILAIGFLPFFEAAFGILSVTKMIELTNPNQPLLRKILLEAPGTYHHSVMVANLSEAACETIGAKGLLARVGSYYHDIGKTRRPHFFIENQMRIDNPHDQITPTLSKKIIIAHPYDGAEMLRAQKFPQEIIDIAEQHHGTTLLKYFYHKALEEDENTAEEDYRYPGPKPQTREAAIVCLADGIEAAVRSMPHPTAEKIQTLIQKMTEDKLTDGQFDECDLTMKELQKAAQSMEETLRGIYHTRIEYPDEEHLRTGEGGLNR